MKTTNIFYLAIFFVFLFRLNVSGQTYTYVNGTLKYEQTTIGSKVKLTYDQTFDSYKIVFRNAEGSYETWFFKPDIFNRKLKKGKFYYQCTQGNVGNYLLGASTYWIIDLSFDANKYAYINITANGFSVDNKISIEGLQRLK